MAYENANSWLCYPLVGSSSYNSTTRYLKSLEIRTIEAKCSLGISSSVLPICLTG
jgi:hypothetical protein